MSTILPWRHGSIVICNQQHVTRVQKIWKKGGALWLGQSEICQVLPFNATTIGFSFIVWLHKTPLLNLLLMLNPQWHWWRTLRLQHRFSVQVFMASSCLKSQDFLVSQQLELQPPCSPAQISDCCPHCLLGETEWLCCNMILYILFLLRGAQGAPCSQKVAKQLFVVLNYWVSSTKERREESTLLTCSKDSRIFTMSWISSRSPITVPRGWIHSSCRCYTWASVLYKKCIQWLLQSPFQEYLTQQSTYLLVGAQTPFHR